MPKKREVKILLDSSAYNLLEKRAKKNFSTVPELISEIIRRSIIAAKKNISAPSSKSDEKFLEYFSRRR